MLEEPGDITCIYHKVVWPGRIQSYWKAKWLFSLHGKLFTFCKSKREQMFYPKNEQSRVQSTSTCFFSMFFTLASGWVGIYFSNWTLSLLHFTGTDMLWKVSKIVMFKLREWLSLTHGCSCSDNSTTVNLIKYIEGVSR